MAATERAARRAETGFSLVEALIATGILLMIAIGVIPLFATSILNNTRGSDSTSATNHSRSQIENLLQLPFSAASLTVPSAATQAETDSWWSVGDTGMMNDSTEGWLAAKPSGTDPANTVVPWIRKTIVTQFSVSALDDGVLGTAEAELGSTPPNNVHLKQVSVEIDSAKENTMKEDASPFGGPLGRGEKITIQVVKAF
jgi:Tfp pilus assembly protein PilV